MKTKTFKLLFVIACLLSSANVLAGDYDFEVDGVYYQIDPENESACSVVSGDVSYKGDFVIPATVTFKNKQYAVIGIEGAFRGCSNLKTVTMPNSVTTIGKRAFGDCTSLTNITIPNSVTTIGYEAFIKCRALTSVTIPNSVTTIDELAFAWCTSLTSVAIPNSVVTIGSGAFRECTHLTNVIIPNSVVTIGEIAFWNCI